jgi:hypothetical protein
MAQPLKNVQLPPPGTLASHRVGFGPQLRRRIGGFSALRQKRFRACDETV